MKKKLQFKNILCCLLLFILSCSDTTVKQKEYGNAFLNIESNPKFVTFKKALIITKFDNMLKDPKLSFSIFVPNNEAFENYFKKNSYHSIEYIPIADLKRIVLYHILDATELSKSKNLQNREKKFETLAQDPIGKRLHILIEFKSEFNSSTKNALLDQQNFKAAKINKNATILALYKGSSNGFTTEVNQVLFPII